jgi:mRNA interferase MazF
MQELFKWNFDTWNEQKRIVHTRNDLNKFHVKPREIWYVKLWINVWFEQNGKREFQRPVLVIERIWILFFVIPLSTKEKTNPYYYKLQSVDFGKPSMVILSQIRVIDKRRFVNPIGLISTDELLVIKKLLKEIYLKGV